MSFPIRRARRPSSLSLSISPESSSPIGQANASDDPSSATSPKALLREALFASARSPTRAHENRTGGEGGGGNSGVELGQEKGRSLSGGLKEDMAHGHNELDESALSVDMEDEQGSAKASPRATSQPQSQPAQSEQTHLNRPQSQPGLQDLLSTHLKEYKLASSGAQASHPAINKSFPAGNAPTDPNHLSDRIWGMPEWKDAVKGEEVRFEYGYGSGQDGSVKKGISAGEQVGGGGRGGVKVISIEDLALLLNHYHKLDTPSEVLFPWMHGLGDGPNGPAGGMLEQFFGYPSLDAPRYRGLTILKAENTTKAPYISEPRARRKSSPSTNEAEVGPSRNPTPVPYMQTSPPADVDVTTDQADDLRRFRTDSVSTYASSESTQPSLSSFGQASDGGASYDQDMDGDEGRTYDRSNWRTRSPASSMSSVALELDVNKDGSTDLRDLNTMQGMHPTCAKSTIVPAMSCPARELAATVSRLLGRTTEGGQDRKDQDAKLEHAEEPPTPTDPRMRFDPDVKMTPDTLTKQRPALITSRSGSGSGKPPVGSIGMSRNTSIASSIATPETPTSASPSEMDSILRTSSAMGRARSPSPLPSRSRSPYPKASSGSSTPHSPILSSPNTQPPDLAWTSPQAAALEAAADDVGGEAIDSRAGPSRPECMLANALCVTEVLEPGPPGRFRKPDMSGEISLRNLSIQEIKYSTISDLVIYGEHGANEAVLETAQRAFEAQEAIQQERRELYGWEREHLDDNGVVELQAMPPGENYAMAWEKGCLVEGGPEDAGQELGAQSLVSSVTWQAQHAGYKPVPYSVFAIKEPFEEIAARFPSLVSGGAIDAAPGIRDLFQREIEESNKLAKATEISKGIWLGNSNDNPFKNHAFDNPAKYDIIIEAHDTADLPGEKLITDLKSILFPVQLASGKAATPDQGEPTWEDPIFLECCSSSRSVGSSHHTLDVLTSRIIALAEVLRKAVDTKQDSKALGAGRDLKVLVFCEDGYTETSIFALTYLMIARKISLEDAYIHLQLSCNRSFFVYPFDMAFLDQIERKLLNKKARVMGSVALQKSGNRWRPFTTGQVQASGHRAPQTISPLRTWIASARFDGSLPSRILPYLYLGNLGHAANSRLLRALGITHIVSVGETVTREFGVAQDHYVDAKDELKTQKLPDKHRAIVVLEIEDVKDDGNDPLRPKIAQACEFIRDAEKNGGKTLVHCRVGVSRSATIVLAYLMQYHGMSLIDAYMMTRCRRLNVLIQPHLRFLHELLGWEVQLGGESDDHASTAKKYNWPSLCRDLWQLNHRFLVRQ